MKRKDIKKYLGQLCMYFTGNISPENKSRVSNRIKNEVMYVFGVPKNKLEKTTNLDDLANRVIKHKLYPSPFQNDLELEINYMLSLC